MADKLSPDRRSANMARIRAKGMKPEMAVRRLAHSLGYRFRLHRKDLPGKPDLVFPGRKAVVFVHGCFWHQHSNPDCRDARLPKSRQDYWVPKLESNKKRDAKSQQELEASGWQVLVLWECELRDVTAVAEKLRSFLGPPGATNVKQAKSPANSAPCRQTSTSGRASAAQPRSQTPRHS